MIIQIIDDHGEVFAEHVFPDDKLINYGTALEKSKASTTQKALALLDLVHEIGDKVEHDVDRYIAKLMGWKK